ncbi:hypothetical protein J6590_044112 [Homalodisca vitripennis]|nr:hypothetical protein J6590_044112 [Homalodisca vitripennis]
MGAILAGLAPKPSEEPPGRLLYGSVQPDTISGGNKLVIADREETIRANSQLAALDCFPLELLTVAGAGTVDTTMWFCDTLSSASVWILKSSTS